ncbi:reverse transcriptase domain-containing protein [Tanacetum coccineum]
MSTNEQTPLSQHTSVVRNTLGKEQIPQDSGRPVFDAALREYCDKNYHKLLPIIAEKVHQENVQQEKLKEVKARLNFEEASQHSESGTPSRRMDLKKRLGSRRIRSMSRSPEPRRSRSESPRKRDSKRKTVFKRLVKAAETLKAVTRVLAQEKQNLLLKNIITKEHPHEGWKRCQKVKQEAGQKQNFKKGGFQNQQRPKRKQDSFTLLTKTPKEILALDKGKFKPPPTMTTPVEKRNASKLCEFHEEVGHSTDECMYLKRQIEEMLKVGKLSHLIKELKQNNGKDQAKAAKKGETSGKDKPLAILMEDGTEGLMIIEAEMGGHFVHRMYVDGGSSLEILYEHCFNRFRPEVKNQMVPATTPLVGFSGEIIWPLGSPSPYNGIIGRSGVKRIQAVPSTTHGMLKFLMIGGTITLQSSRIIPLECTMVSGPGVSQPVINQVTKEKIQVAIHLEYLEQTITIGSTLTEEGRKELCILLRRNVDIFAWKPADMSGVPRHIAEHRLNIREGCLPVRQKKMGQAPKRNKAIYEEVEKLVNASIMKEVHYHSCLSNPVMVKKYDDSWRMRIDFKDLNKACPKDGYPLPKIYWKIESLCGYPFKCFLDAYKGYHQIKMAKEDEEKTSFITNQGIFCYSKMSFGLKNAGATYQRLVDKAFQKQIGRNLEVYVDDLVNKSFTEQEIIRDMEDSRPLER